MIAGDIYELPPHFLWTWGQESAQLLGRRTAILLSHDFEAIKFSRLLIAGGVKSFCQLKLVFIDAGEKIRFEPVEDRFRYRTGAQGVDAVELDADHRPDHLE